MAIRNNKLRIAFLMAVIFFLAAFCPGCGKKGNPVPPEIKIPEAVNDLSVKIAEGKIILAWSVPESNTDVAEFKIYRSALEIEGDSCPGCPREYLLIAELPFRDPKLVREGKKGLSYLDSDIIGAGYLYSYKVAICGSHGYCSDDSNIAEVKY